MTDLPEPGADARAHSERVASAIRAAIVAAGGDIPFTRYMEIALYAPGLGYYAAGARKLGAAGDFVTAPEMTPLFAVALAAQVAPILEATGRREIVELGGGSGRLAADLLAALAARDALPARYAILEPSPDLAQRQRATLARDAAHALPLVSWIDALPETIDGALIANEVLDAVPAALVARRGDAWLERGVTWDDAHGRFAWTERAADARLAALAASRYPRDGDYLSEVNPAAEALVLEVGRRLTGGAALFIDYGFPAAEYYHPQRGEGTLMCHYRHLAHGDPFAWPGLTDITAHVDFTAMAEAGERAGLEVAGYTALAPFLLGCGMLDALAATGPPESQAYIRAVAPVQRLLAPSEMGELFKVLALARPDSIAWPGFALADRRHRLSGAPATARSPEAVPQTTEPDMDSPIATNSLVMGSLVARHARLRPRHTAVIVAPRTPDEREIRLSWRDLDAYVNRWANALSSLGVVRGDHVATVLANSLELLATYWACAKLGAAVVPLSPLLTATGLASLLADAAPRVVVGHCDQVAVLDEVRRRTTAGAAPVWVLVDAAADDEALGYRAFGTIVAGASDAGPSAHVEAGDLWTLMYTSGTTGLPKGIPHTHFIRAMYATTMASAWRMAPESVVLHSGSIVFNGAMTTLLPAFMLGATFVLHRAFDAAEFIRTVERERVTHTMLVPSQIIAILNARDFDPARLVSLEMILSLGAPLHQEYKDRLNALLPRRFYELYGLTEGFVTILDRDDALRKSGSVGVPPPFYAMRIVDRDGRDLPAGEVGEIVGRGPITMPGYYNRPDLTNEALRDGWLYTGDLGYADDEGYLHLVDRKKDMIDSGGVKIYPKDIEEIAARHPDVLEVAVFGIPDEKWGETPIAAVVLRRSDSVGADELRDWINARVAAKYQRLARVIVMHDFPRSAAGKTLKRELRAPFWEGRDKRI